MSTTIQAEPITDADLPEVCEFLRKNFNSKCPTTTWVAAFLRKWHPSKPNNGFMLRDQGVVVGAFGALYSIQQHHGQPEEFCNLTSLYVHEDYRKHSLPLILAMLRQGAYHFTALSANEVAGRIYQGMGFEVLPTKAYALPNIFSPLSPAFWQATVVKSPQLIAEVLQGERKKICLDHADCPDIKQLAVGNTKDGFCHIIYRSTTCRNLPCAHILDLSDEVLFRKFIGRIAAMFLLEAKCLVMRVPVQQMHLGKPLLAIEIADQGVAFFHSTTLQAQDISCLYSEILGLCGC